MAPLVLAPAAGLVLDFCRIGEGGIGRGHPQGRGAASLHDPSCLAITLQHLGYF